MGVIPVRWCLCTSPGEGRQQRRHVRGFCNGIFSKPCVASIFYYLSVFTEHSNNFSKLINSTKHLLIRLRSPTSFLWIFWSALHCQYNYYLHHTDQFTYRLARIQLAGFFFQNKSFFTLTFQTMQTELIILNI